MSLQSEILALKKEQGAVILAHNYVAGDIQDIADFCGDSLELSVKAKNVSAPVIVFCGVRFMAETAKILSPDSKVLLPHPQAGCPMADMADAAAVWEMRRKHPDAVFCAYVNSTAETKAEIDICCTSGNVENVLASIPAGKEIVFLPDGNLGANMIRKTGRSMTLWKGCCPIHDAVTPEMIRAARALHPGVEILVHPECRPEVVEAADRALSTGGMLKYIRGSSAKSFIVGTECGILHRLRKENPDKTFYTLSPEPVCADMKKLTLEHVLSALKTGQEEIILPEDIMKKALLPIERMIAVGR